MPRFAWRQWTTGREYRLFRAGEECARIVLTAERTWIVCINGQPVGDVRSLREAKDIGLAEVRLRCAHPAKIQ